MPQRLGKALSRFGRPTRAMARSMVLALLLIVLAAPILAPTAFAQEVPELKINSKRYIVIDADTGEVFAQRGADQQAAMASLTKVFTVIEALESAPIDTTITTTEDDIFNPVSSSVMGLGPNETHTLEDLLYGMMLPSGNDAAYAIARALGGAPEDDETSVAAFVERMNQRLAAMGLSNTHLMNPHGWGVPNHYSTARDLAAFVMYALKYPTFVDLISTYEHTTADGNYTLYNNNRLLREIEYEHILGGKTGYDLDSGWCLIEVARKNGNTMISVTMDGEWEGGDWYDDNRVLLEYAFEQKEKRVAENRPISGEVVSFLDPDAPLIAKMATAGAALGVPAAPADGSDQASDNSPAPPAGLRGGAEPGAAVPTRVAAVVEVPNPDLSAALVVAAGIILLGAVGTFRRLGRST